MKRFKQHLKEMPYIEVDGGVTDLELESIKTKAQFLTFLKYFFGLSKKTPKDKYNVQLTFKNDKEREKIKKVIYNDKQINHFIKSIQMSKSELKKTLEEM